MRASERGLQDRPSPSGKNKVTTKGKIETEERKQTQIPNLHCLVKVWPFLFIDSICPDPNRRVLCFCHRDILTFMRQEHQISTLSFFSDLQIISEKN